MITLFNMKKFTVEWIKPMGGGGIEEIEALNFADAEKKFCDWWKDVGTSRFIIKIEELNP